jgi:DNA modification methylase
MIALYNDDNVKIMKELYNKGLQVDLVYADCIYESTNLDWIWFAISLLKDNGIFIVQTDWHTLGLYLEQLAFYGLEIGESDLTFINHLVWKNEWGNHPKDRFHQCYDDILIYCKGDKWKFYSDRIQVPKATSNTKLNPSGRETKTATAWIDDICLTTTSKERVKKDDGHLIQWQKPKRLLNRIFSPFVDFGDLILDPFMGSGSSGEVAIDLGCHYIGIENDPLVFSIAENRLKTYVNS